MPKLKTHLVEGLDKFFDDLQLLLTTVLSDYDGFAPTGHLHEDPQESANAIKDFSEREDEFSDTFVSLMVFLAGECMHLSKHADLPLERVVGILETVMSDYTRCLPEDESEGPSKASVERNNQVILSMVKNMTGLERVNDKLASVYGSKYDTVISIIASIIGLYVLCETLTLSNIGNASSFMDHYAGCAEESRKIIEGSQIAYVAAEGEDYSGLLEAFEKEMDSYHSYVVEPWFTHPEEANTLINSDPRR